MLEKQFEKFGYFIERKYRPIIAIWVVIFLIALPFAFDSTNMVNYNVEFTGTSSNSMSQEAQDIMNEQFKTNNNSSNDTAVVVFVNSSFNSSTAYEFWSYFNSTYKTALQGSGYSGIVSPYTIYSKFVNSLGQGTYKFYKQIVNISNKINSSYESIILLSRNTNSTYKAIQKLDDAYQGTYVGVSTAVKDYYGLIVDYYQGTNYTAFILYGIPLLFLNTYEQISIMYQNLSNQTKDILAKNQVLNYSENFQGNPIALSYFNYFYNYWNNSSGQLQSRLNNSISSAYYSTIQNLNTTEASLFQYVSTSMDLSQYMNQTLREVIVLNITYQLGYAYAKSDPSIYNSTFQCFSQNGNLSRLEFNLTVQYLNNTSGAIKELFNESVSNFLSSVINQNISENFIINQLNNTQLGSYVIKASQNIGLTENEFIDFSLNSSINKIKDAFVNSTAPNIVQLSNLTMFSPSQLTISLLINTTSSIYNITGSFLARTLKYSPFAFIQSDQKFISDTISTEGNLTDLVPSNPVQVGLNVNYTLFGLLVPANFSGYTLIITFNQSSLNTSQLVKINQYLGDLQSNFPMLHVYYTGSDEIAHGLEQIANQSLIYSMIIGIIISIVIVGIYFRSWKLAFVPMGFFVFSMTITMAIAYIIFGMILHSNLSFIATTLSAILILGLSVDYTVYIMNRFFRNSSENRVRTTVQWAGHAVFTSSIIVIVSYLVMALFNIPLIGDGGYLNSLGIAITLSVALTLLPSFLHFFHRDRILKHSVNFEKVAKVSRNHRYSLTALLILLLVISLIIYEVTPTSFDLLSLIPNNPGKAGYYAMVNYYGFDAFSNNYVILKLPYPMIQHSSYNSSDLSYLNQIENSLFSTGYVKLIQTVNYPYYNQVNISEINSSFPSSSIIINQSQNFIGRSPYYVLLNIYTTNVSFSQASINEISIIDKEMNSVSKILGVQYWVGGPSQSLLDSSSFIKDSTYTIVEVLAVIIFAVLSYQLSAILTPLRLLLNVGVSTLTSVTIFYAVFYYLLHYPIIVFGPLFVIVTLFGVGLDYDIFLITRTREEVFKGKDDEAAIEEALKENAGVIVALGLIISGVFGALMFSPIQIISEIGFSITVGVLFETMISWMFLIPSLMLIMKKFNWWPSKIRNDKN